MNPNIVHMQKFNDMGPIPLFSRLSKLGAVLNYSPMVFKIHQHQQTVW